MTNTNEPTVTCPRCAKRVSTDYRYCPECAFRLQTGVLEDPAPAAQPSVVPHVLLLLGALALVGGFVLAGFLLFNKDEVHPQDPDVAIGIETGQRARTVADLSDDMTFHKEDLATWREYTGDLAKYRDRPNPYYRVWVSDMRVARYEVTRGQWREFLDDLLAHDLTYAFEFVDKRLYRPVEGLVEDLAQDGNERLMSHDIGGPAGFGGDQAVSAAARAVQQLRWTQTYVGRAKELIELWWQAVARGHEARTGIRLGRPAFLKTFPVADDMILWLLTPPAWVEVGPDGQFSRVFDELTADRPVTQVTYFDALAFARWASVKLHVVLSLPLRSQFMRAYHNGALPDEDTQTGNRWPWGLGVRNHLCNSASMWASHPELTPTLFQVTQVLGNEHLRRSRTELGLAHMAGNAREWVLPERYVFQPQEDDKDAEGDAALRAYFYAQAISPWRAVESMGGSYLTGIEECDWQSGLTTGPLVREPDIGFRLYANGRVLDGR